MRAGQQDKISCIKRIVIDTSQIDSLPKAHNTPAIILRKIGALRNELRVFRDPLCIILYDFVGIARRISCARSIAQQI